MSASPVSNSTKRKTPERGYCRPHASPTSHASCELTTVALRVEETGPLSQNDPPAQALRRAARFGAPSQSPFFARNKPHPQRVRHIKGINDQPICDVNDVTFGPVPQYCLGRALTPETCLVLQCKIPVAAIATNSTYLPTDVLTGLQFFPLRYMDSPLLKLQVTDAWREELRDLTEKAGLLGPINTGRGSAGATSPQRSPMTGSSGRSLRDGSLKLQLMVIDMLCQILQTAAIGDVQQWLLTAGQREKDQVLSLLCAALARGPALASDAPDGEVLTVREVTLPRGPALASDAPDGEVLTVREVTPASRITSTGEKDHTSSDNSPEPISRCESEIPEDVETEGPPVAVTPLRRRTPRTETRALSSPPTCNLNQKVVLRYSKRVLVPVPTKVFQEEWPNYTQKADLTLTSLSLSINKLPSP